MVKKKPLEKLCEAAEKGDLALVKKLIATSRPQDLAIAHEEQANPLDLAVYAEHLDCVQELIKVYDAKILSSRLLCVASSKEHQDIFDVLYEVSDPEKALKLMLEDNGSRKDKRMEMLRTRMRIDEEHRILNEEVGTTQYSRSKKM